MERCGNLRTSVSHFYHLSGKYLMRSPLRFLITALALVSGIGAANAADTKPLKVFFLTQSGTFEHSVVQRKSADKLSLAEESVIAIGKESGAFTVQCSKDSTMITPELLKDLDVMMFYTTGEIKGGAEDAPHKLPADEWSRKMKNSKSAMRIGKPSTCG